MSESQLKFNSGRFWMINGVTNKFVKSEDVPNLILDGYHKGRTVNKPSK